MDILSITFVACFPSLTIEILEAGIFDGPQIWKLLKDTEIKEVMTDSEAMAWETLAYVVMNFLGNHESENYVDMVKNLFMLSKLFQKSFGSVFRKQGERFHQAIKEMEVDGMKL